MFQPAAKISNLEGWLKSDEEGGSFAIANLNAMYTHFKEHFKVVAGDVDGLLEQCHHMVGYVTLHLNTSFTDHQHVR